MLTACSRPPQSCASVATTFFASNLPRMVDHDAERECLSHMCELYHGGLDGTGTLLSRCPLPIEYRAFNIDLPTDLDLDTHAYTLAHGGGRLSSPGTQSERALAG